MSGLPELLGLLTESKDAEERFHAFVRLKIQEGGMSPVEKSTLVEADHRLSQLRLVLEDITRLLIILRGLDLGDEHRSTMLRIETYNELFYWIASRALRILKRIPEFQNFEADQVRNVRNHLIEHPESTVSGVDWVGYGIGEGGPTVRGVRHNDQLNWWDNGLAVNAKEFFDNFLAIVRNLPGSYEK